MAIPEAPLMTMMNPILNPKQPIAILNTDDVDVGLKIKYVGTQKSATVEVNASGLILLKHGVAGSEAADTTIQIGATPGTIDVSDASGNTFAEVIDHINGSANWEAYLVGALRADSSNASTGSLLARSATTISPNVDLPLYKDTSKVLNLAVRIGKRSAVSGSEERAACEIYSITSLNTFASGTNLIKIYEINEVEKTETLVYSLAGGATTAENTKTFVNNGRGSLGVSKVGNHLLVKMVGSAACTGSIQVVGAVGTGL